jgi:Winged helix DNA-binding domain
MDVRTAALLRVRAQGLERGEPNPAAAVRRLLAVQAQDVVSPLAAIALRTRPEAGRSSVEAAFADGRLVRSWTMRGTLHVVAAEDVGWLLALTGARTLAAGRTVRARLGIDDAALDAAQAVAEAVLPVGGLRRGDLLAAFSAAGLDPAGNRGYHLLLALAARGVLHIGGRDGGQYRFHPSAGVLPAPEALEQDEALARLAVRYLAGHGPATDRDLAWWAAIPVTWARRAIDAAAAGLLRVEIDGRTAWTAADADGPAEPDQVVALPAFDELLLGYADRAAVLGPHPLEAIVPGRNGRFLPVVVHDGRVVAVWDARDGPRVRPLEPLPAALLERAEAAAARRADWLAGGGADQA